MFFRRRRFNANVKETLTRFGIDTRDAGTFKTLEVLDTAWASKFSVRESALMVAYTYAGGLLKQDRDEGMRFIEETLKPIEADWKDQGLVREEIVSKWPAILDKRIAEATGE